jgi:zinc transport system ATP-binding protein
MNKTIEIKNLYFSYDKDEVLHNINLQISSKDFLAVIGPNGGGKSTLLKLLLGILKPSKGEIKIFGKLPEDMFLKLGYVPQDTNINKNFPIKVLDVVLQGRIGISKKFWGYSEEDIIIAKESLKKVGAYEFKDKKIGELSGGQRQRVFIARALSTNADVLLLDEPTSSIDSKGQISLYATLKELNEQKGIIVVSHDVNVVLGFANKVAYTDKTLFMHNSPALNKDKILKSIGSSTGHICPVELMVNENMCLHTHDKEKT